MGRFFSRSVLIGGKNPKWHIYGIIQVEVNVTFCRIRKVKWHEVSFFLSEVGLLRRRKRLRAEVVSKRGMMGDGRAIQQ